ncbi:MAG: DsbA family protein [Bauldia sp.]|uniref:DsbA family protein n=1 Tax=Bauldia sp. TaxID=2575872 RepID=UPI001D6F460A|nr:DsbA family protein [Bauldia sp.]MCB1494810.1 DsbA family protein [Bauldia sp.]
MKRRQFFSIAAASIAGLGTLALGARMQTGSLLGEALLVTPAQAATSEAMLEAGPLGEKTMGDPNAPNVVIEYASMTCPHCQHFHETTFTPFKEKYIDTGEVYFIFRHFPLNPLDIAAIMLTNCVPEERFFPLVDLLYDQQANWAFVDKPAEALLNLVKQAGFTQESFTACLKDQEVLDGIDWVRKRAADDFGVDSTPTFFINGEKTSGALTLEQLDELLAE